MRASVDEAGRVEIPRDILDEAGLSPGTELDVRVRDGIVELVPATLPVRLERRKYLLVAIPDVPVAPLTSEEVEQAREALLTECSPD